MSKFHRENSCSSVCTGCCENSELSDDGEYAPEVTDSDDGLGIVSAEEDAIKGSFAGSSSLSNIQPYIVHTRNSLLVASVIPLYSTPWAG